MDINIIVQLFNGNQYLKTILNVK